MNQFTYYKQEIVLPPLNGTVEKMKFFLGRSRTEQHEKSRYSEEQVIGILREGVSGTPLMTVSAKHIISDATYYAWKRQYGGMDVS